VRINGPPIRFEFIIPTASAIAIQIMTIRKLSEGKKPAIPLSVGPAAFPCVREVAAYIGSGPWGRWTKVNGSIQSEVQRARSRAVVAAGEFTGRSGVTNGWDQRHDTGALAG
jgi:hypothetical protein